MTPRSRRILIAGCGDLGVRLAARPELGTDTVFGLRRHPERLPAPLQPVAADLEDPHSLRSIPDALDAVIYTATPGARSDAAYRAACVEGLRNLLDARPAIGRDACRLVLVSSTSVYGQDDGSAVDESSPTEPSHFSGRRLLEAEALARSRTNAVIVRFSGIYGPGRTRLIDRVRARIPVSAQPRLWTNRIHSDDCAAVLAHLLALPRPDPVYIGSDDEPAPLDVVQNTLAGLLGQAPLPTASDAGPPGERGRRCCNARLRSSGLQLRYPNHRRGYRALLADPGQGRLGV